MKANTFLSRDNEIQEYISLIEDCKMIEPMAKEILNNNPFAWANIVTKAFDVTVKGNIVSTNTFATYIADCTFVKFKNISEDNTIFLAVEKGMLVFIGNGDIEEILQNALFTISF